MFFRASRHGIRQCSGVSLWTLSQDFSGWLFKRATGGLQGVSVAGVSVAGVRQGVSGGGYKKRWFELKGAALSWSKARMPNTRGVSYSNGIKKCR